MSISDLSKGFTALPPVNCRFPAESDPARIPPPILPSMSSLLPRHEQMGHEQHPYSPRQYQQPPPHVTQHPLWLSEQDPNAPPKHIYHPPQRRNSHSVNYQADPLLVQNPNSGGLPAPEVSQGTSPGQPRQVKRIAQRRDDNLKDHDDSRSSPTMLVRHNSRGEQNSQEVKKGPYSRQYPLGSEPSSAKTPHPQSQSSKSMPISRLLIDGPSPEIERAPPPKYTIRMRQEPMAARACGFGERDRRVIDPPPILQMDVESHTHSPEAISTMIRNPYTVVHCTLWDPAVDRDDTAMPGTTDKRQQRRLMGTLVASPFVGLDEHDVEGCFFTFPDLSVRTPGTYSLKFSLVVLDPRQMRSGTSAPVRSTVKSSIFHVYNAKDFCGMRASTELTKKLKHQGCLISVKKGNSRSNGSAHPRDDDDDDEDMDDDDDDEGGDAGPSAGPTAGSATKKGKKPKR